MSDIPQRPRGLHTSAELENLATIRYFIEEHVLALGGDRSVADDLMQAVDECATNIIVHGYRHQPGPIDLEIEHQDDTWSVHLRDQAPPFDPTSVPPPDLALPLEERPLGGLGIYLVRHMVDRLEYRAPPQGGNELILIKQVKSDAAHS